MRHEQKFKRPCARESLQQLKESATLAMAQKQKNLNLNWKAGFGESAFPCPEILSKAIQRESYRNSYSPTNGNLELKKGFARFYEHHFNIKLKQENFFIFPGSKMAFFSLGAILKPSYFLIPEASWVSYEPQAIIHSHQAVWLKTEAQNAYKLTASTLEYALKKLLQDGQNQNAPLLFLNSPNNPTGAVYSREELRDICHVCRNYGVLILFDSIYAHKTDFSKKKFSFPYEFYPEGTIISSGLSKTFSSGGKRLGFIYLPSLLQTLKKTLTSYMSETISSVDTTLQHASCELFSAENLSKTEDYIFALQEINALMTNYLYQKMQALGLETPFPKGGFYLFPSFESYRKRLAKIGIKTSRELSLHLLEKLGISCLPGESFGLEASKLSLRISSQDFSGEKALAAYQKGKKLDECFVEEYAVKLVNGMKILELFLSGL